MERERNRNGELLAKCARFSACCAGAMDPRPRKVRWLGNTEFLMLTAGKTYDVLAVERGWYRIADDSGEDYLYPPERFAVVEE